MLEGELTVKLDGQTSVLGEGETATVEAGVWHDWWNASDRDARVRVEITPGERVRAVPASRIVYRNGVPIAAMEGDSLKMLCEVDPDVATAAAAAAGRDVPMAKGYAGRLG